MNEEPTNKYGDRDADKHPDVLRITVRSDAAALDAMGERMDRWAEGETVPAVVSLGSARDLRRLLTDRRIELLQSIMGESPASISALAERVGRHYREVYEDVELLAEHGIVYFQHEGSAKRPWVPYERIELDMAITAEQPA